MDSRSHDVSGAVKREIIHGRIPDFGLAED